MKVTCSTFSEFLSNLRQDGQSAANSEVWFRVDEMQANPKNDVDFNVFVWATAVIARDSMPYILEYGECVGMRIRMGNEKTEQGVVVANEMRRRLDDECKALGLSVRTGKVEF